MIRRGGLDRRRQRPNPKRVPLATVEKVLRLYRERYFDSNVRHFVEKVQSEHGIELRLHVDQDGAADGGLGGAATKTGSASQEAAPAPAAWDVAACPERGTRVPRPVRPTRTRTPGMRTSHGWQYACLARWSRAAGFDWGAGCRPECGTRVPRPVRPTRTRTPGTRSPRVRSERSGYEPVPGVRTPDTPGIRTPDSERTRRFGVGSSRCDQ